MNSRPGIISFIISLFFLLYSPMIHAQDTGAGSGFAGRTNEFALEIYRSINEEPYENLFVSPAGIHTVLSLLYAGARGETAEEMAAALKAGNDPEVFHEKTAAVQNILRRIGGKGDVKLTIANSLWPQSGFGINRSFQKLADQYGCDVTAVDYRRQAEAARNAINEWGSRNTNNLIPEIISRKLPPDTYLLIANAIYFKGNWARQFNPSDTEDEPFYTESGEVLIPMMFQEGWFDYFQNEGVEVLVMPYTGGDVSMLIVLPEDPTGLQALIGQITADDLSRWKNKAYEEIVHVYLPGFTLRSDLDLIGNGDLKKMGIVSALKPGSADFTGMIDNPYFYIRSFVQSTYVKVNEEGTEAAAVTVGGGCFPIDTPVGTTEGLIPIQDITAGTRVHAYDLEKSEWVYAAVEAMHTYDFTGDMITIETGNETLEATWNHPFMVADGEELEFRRRPADLPPGEPVTTDAGRWVEAVNLRSGDKLLAHDGRLRSVTQVLSRTVSETVYYLEVADHHNHTVGSSKLLVHNGGTKESAAPQVYEFRADHPFMFFIYDNKTYTILFMGHVGNPGLSH